MDTKQVIEMARRAIDVANRETAHGTYNDGYVHGYADALKKVCGLMYFAVSADSGTTWTWQWLTEDEAEKEREAGRLVKA